MTSNEAAGGPPLRFLKLDGSWITVIPKFTDGDCNLNFEIMPGQDRQANSIPTVQFRH